MSLKDHPRIISGTIIVAVAGLFWNIGHEMRGDRIAELETEIATYRLTETLDARNLLSSLKNASEDLSSNLGIVAEIQSLRQANTALADSCRQASLDILAQKSESDSLIQSLRDALSRKTAAISNERDEFKAKYEAAMQELKELVLENETFSISVGESRTFGAYDLTVGYVEYSGTTSIQVIFDNKLEEMQVGSVITADANGKVCQLTLDKFEWGTRREPATFTFVVKN